MPCHPDAHGQRAGRDGTQRAGGTVRRVRQEGRAGHFLPRQRAAHARDGARRVRGEGGTGELLRPHPAGHRAGSGGVRGVRRYIQWMRKPAAGGIVSKIEPPLKSTISEGVWSEWGDSNARSLDPKLLNKNFSTFSDAL